MVKCQYCGKEYHEKGITSHESSCKENPINKAAEPNTETVESPEVAQKETTTSKSEPETGVVSERMLKKAYNTMKEKLADEEQVDIFIPPTQLYPEGTNLPICVNGVTYTVPVGTTFEKGVPKSIYEAWKTSYEADRETRQKMKKKLTGKISIS